jgi:Flp pilus assembly protein TadG
MKYSLSKLLRTDERGVAAIEFAMMFPLLFAALFGCAEILNQVYTRSNVQMLVNDAARDSIVGSGTLSSIEDSLRTKLEILPGLYPGGDLDISICREKGCDAPLTAVKELTKDLNGNNVCDSADGDKWQDMNRNGIMDAAGAVVAGNSLGGPGDPVVFEVQVKARYFFSVLTTLGDKDTESEILSYSVRSLGTNEDFVVPELGCPA